MKPATQAIEIYQGDTFFFYFRIRTKVWSTELQQYVNGAYMDLTNFTVSAEVRATKTAPSALVAFTAIKTDQTAIPGGIILKLSAAQTTGLPATGGVWDVQLTNPSAEVRTYIAGTVTVIEEVTRV